tara:strand:- start:247 stop:429 length:183 start_codon:yes stop_codon:yes gene_type:complete
MAQEGFANLLELQLQLDDVSYYVIDNLLGAARRVAVNPGRHPGEKVVVSADGQAVGTVRS